MVDRTLTPYDVIGEEKLSELVLAFYHQVANHPDLKSIFPEDFTETIRKQQQFLTQYLGGPSVYTEEHGHPMLRARHLPHAITKSRADAWLSCMEKAMDEVELNEGIRDGLFHRLTLTAHHMINTPEKAEGDTD
ncbi:globin domain-containing protein [Jeotgalibacillus campisalis]|uniref:Globin n=1 Tax=Jeotgalibacillus campisalis TaxID=220754 RepID=A0A0C2RAS7_9BACL|nr:globin [Jeotgalibacillus campisalis]KIL47420.1 globin [Jeotgalibacillus campisalis]